MAYTSPSEVNMTDGIDNLFVWLNEVTNMWFGNMIMLAIYFIFFFGYLRSNKDDYAGAFAVSSYVSFVIGLLFWVIGIINGYVFGILIGLTAISTFALLRQKKDY